LIWKEKWFNRNQRIEQNKTYAVRYSFKITISFQLFIMNFSAKTIPYQQTGHFSGIVTDYLNGNEFLRHFYEHPVSFAGLEASMHERENFATDRQLLVRSLEEQYDGLPIYVPVVKNINSLSNKNTFTITTAHQPAIFTGNLYFIYKILHVIKIADDLSVRYPDKHFVPVFYMGSEDADLDELGNIFLDNEKLVWETSQTGAVGRMRTEGLEKIILRIEGEFGGHAFGPDLIQLLRDCYLKSENIQQATQKLLHHLFGSYGLIVLIPDNRLLKSVMRGVFKDDLTSHIPFKITEENVLRLSEKYPAQAKPREINLFYLKDNMRERLDFRDNKFVVHNSHIQFQPDEMERELANFPERFSPNVILRGLYQETILPNIAFVGGGGETAYWLEFKPLFKHYRVPYPVIILRNSFLLIKKNWRNKVEKAGLTEESLFKPEEELMENFVRRNSSRQLNLEKQMSELSLFYSSVKSISGAVDKTLEQHVEKLETQALQKLEELEKKILRAEKKNHEEVRRKIHEIREALFPLENLQERIDNFIPWYAEYGNAFLEVLYKNSLTLEQEFTILEENTES
jgi:bacillithiol biosynthesis cysteine-adding enzyme BshC